MITSFQESGRFESTSVQFDSLKPLKRFFFFKVFDYKKKILTFEKIVIYFKFRLKNEAAFGLMLDILDLLLIVFSQFIHIKQDSKQDKNTHLIVFK